MPKRPHQDGGGSRKAARSEEDSGVRSHKELYSTPSHDELRELRETEDLFKSNLFRLQMTELLGEVRVKYDSQSTVDAALHAVKAALEGMKPEKEQQVTADTTFGKKGQGIRAPIAIAPELASLKYTFAKPAKVTVVGSYLLRSVAKPTQNVDLAVEIPPETLEVKDQLNYRYLHKRAYYLGSLAAALSKNKAVASVSYSFVQGNVAKPILVIKPKVAAEGEGGGGKGKKTRFVIRIHPCVSASTFKVAKLAPDRNNVRRAKCDALLPEGTPAAAEGAGETATPRYNATVLSDMLMEHHLELLYNGVYGASRKSIDNAPDATLLLKTWLRQRGMTGDVFGAFNGFTVSMLIFHLFQERKITRRSSSFQIFRAVISFIATTDWMVEGVAMKYQQFSDDFPAEAAIPELASFHAAFDVVFVDPSGFLNLMAHTTVGSYLELKHEAERALALLDDRVNDGFDALFMTPVPWHNKFDLTVVCDKVTPQIARRYPSQLLDRGGDWEAFSMSFIATVIRRAMGDRATLVTSQPRSVGSWAITDPIPSALAGGLHGTPTGKITVGLLLHSANAVRRLELGPSADDAAAPAFRDFWGPVAQLRRFPDGSVMEAVLWDHPPAQAQLTPKSIIHHTLERHANLKPKNVGISIGPLDNAITAFGSDVGDTGAEDSRAAITRLDELLKQLRSVASSLPLGIAGLTGVSPQFRYTEPLPVRSTDGGAAAAGGAAKKPLPGAKSEYPEWVPAMEVILRFETSGSWPDDVVAIQKVKVAFHLRLAQIVKTKLKLPAVATNQYVDIFCAPYVFRLTIFVEKQVNILKSQLVSLTQMIEAAGGQGASGVATDELVASKTGLVATVAELERYFVQLPAHSAFAHATQMANPSYGKAVRLAKRWLCAHMFSDVVGDEAVELLVASLYHTPGAYTAPVSANVAFLRFLKLVSSFDWKNEALIVSAKDEMTAIDLSDIKRMFKGDRDRFPSMAVFSAGDRDGSVWTKNGPDKQILRRMVAFARETAKVLQRHTESAGMKKQGGMADVMQLFRTSLSDYDVLIKLKTSGLPRKEHKVDYAPPSAKSQRKKYKNLAVDADDQEGTESNTLVEHDPVQCYLRDLKKHYGGHALFFYDKLGGDVIGVVWNPDAVAPCAFKAVYSQDAGPVEGADGGGGGGGAASASGEGGGSSKKKKKAKKGDGESAGPGQITLNIPAVMAGFRTLGHGLVKSVTAK